MTNPSNLPSRQSDEARCANCGDKRDDLIELQGQLWCPTVADCDRTLYYRAAIADHRWAEEVGPLAS